MVVAEENASEGTEEAGKGKKKIVIIALIAIVLLGGGGAAVMLTGSGETEVAGGEGGATETAVPVPKPIWPTRSRVGPSLESARAATIPTT